ncbi:hypothetical protein B5V90_14930 [Heyndrickxia sporothermodurans]|nr:hypothetical protein B5V90_14930 [Heyndrickxia sporothermodurans]
MSVFVNKDTKVIVQGITGKTALFHTKINEIAVIRLKKSEFTAIYDAYRKVHLFFIIRAYVDHKP